MRIRSVSVVASAVLLASVAWAEDMPKPQAEMSQMTYFEGSWSCSGKAFQTPMSPASSMTSTVQIRKDLGGHWQTGIIKGTVPNMPPFEGQFHVTYDPQLKSFVMLWVDNSGGYAQTTSSGWKGDTMVYEGDGHMGGQTMKSRDTFVKSGAGTMKHTSDMQINGKWTPAGEETCTKK